MATQHIALPSQGVSTDVYVELPNNQINPTTKRKLIIITIAAVLLIIVVSCVAASIEYEYPEDSDDSNYYWTDDYRGEWREVYYDGEVNYVCGTRYDCEGDIHPCFDTLNSTNCASLCDTETADDWDIRNAYYIPTLNHCYCYTYSQSYVQSTEGSYCSNTTETVKEYAYAILSGGRGGTGRPYYLDLKTMQHLRSDISVIDCNKYNYYADDEWVDFVTQNYSDMNGYNMDMNEWIKRGLSEHASIASFSKNTLELMSIGAPLWLIELSNKAGLDEIKHTQIAFDVVNMIYNGDRDGCITTNVFPKHDILIDGDWNKISKDIAIGGCIGETVSAFTMSDEYKYGDDVLSKYMNGIVMDEIRHSALAFVSVRWIIDTHPDVDVAKREWWLEQIGSGDYVHESVIPSIVDKLWMDIEEIGGYETFYGMVQQELEYQLKQRHVVDNHCNI